MPKVSIREIDNTGSENLEYLNYTVLIPGPKLEYKITNSENKEELHILEGLFTKASQITNLKFINATEGYKTELAYLMTTQLLSRGLSVYFFPAYTISKTTDRTTNKTSLKKTLLKNPGESDSQFLTRIFEQFSDKGKYDLRFITLGGIDETISDSVFEKATRRAWKCAGDRGDAVAILNTPQSISGNIDFYSVYVKEGETKEYSEEAREGFTSTYLSPELYDRLTEENKAKCKAWTGFKTYIKTVKDPSTQVETKYYSKDKAEGYVETTLFYNDYIGLALENQKKCTPQASLLGELKSSSDIDLWVNEKFGAFADSPIQRSGVSWSGSENATETYGRYGAMFAPHVNVTLSIDGQATPVILPASFNYLACFAKYIGRYKSWFAMSGSVRGVSPYSNITPTMVFGDADINNVLQIRTSDQQGHLATNTICEIRPYGNIVWGNRTLHPLKKPDNGDSNSGIQLTASSFLNIRQLCCEIKKTLYRAARRFTFEPNSDALWYNFKGVISPLLDEMKANQGIKGYQIIKLKTGKKALLVAKIKIVPIEAVEDFDLTVELADSIEVTE